MSTVSHRSLRVACLAAALALAAWPGRAQENGTERRAVIEKWVETKRLISKERQDWHTARVILEDRIDLVARETADLRAKTEEAQTGIGKADETLAELSARNDDLKEMTEGLDQSIGGIEGRVRELLALCPAPIRERVRPLSQRMPLDPGEAKMALSERFQNVIGILNELGKFSRDIMEASEVRELPDGSRAEVAVLYLGLGQAYYCNINSGVAGIGRPAEGGGEWGWEPDNTLAPRVANLQAVFRNEKPAVYIPIPAEVR